MKILLYTPATTGGHAEYTTELIRGLAADRSLEVHLATREDAGADYREAGCVVHAVLPRLRRRQDFRTPAHWASSRLGYHWQEARVLQDLIWSQPWHTVHFQELSPVFHRGLLARDRGRRRFVHTVHNVHPHGRFGLGLDRAYARLTTEAWARFDALVLHSGGLRDAVAARLGARHPQLEVIPHGIWSVPPPPARNALPSRPLRLLFLGVLRPNKGLHTLLDVLVAARPRVELTIAGAVTDPGYFRTAIEPRLARAQAAGITVTTEFRFLPKEDMLQRLQATDFLVLPYAGFESQSGMLMYAAACHVPVIASDCGALGESVRHHVLGWVYPPDNPRALESLIAGATPADAVALQENVRRYAAAHAWSAVAGLHARLYRAVIDPALNAEAA